MSVNTSNWQGSSMSEHRRSSRYVRQLEKLGTGVGLAGAAALIGLATPVAHADVTDINGWTLEQAPDSTVLYTLDDPSDSLGLGSPVSGIFAVSPYALDHSEQVDVFQLNPVDSGSQTLDIRDEWLTPSLIETAVDANNGTTGGATEGFFTTALGGSEVVDLLNVQPSSSSLAEAYNPTIPVINPDATGPVDVNGIAVASPQDGALFNDIYAALVTGSATDWANAQTLTDDLFGISSTDAASALTSDGSAFASLLTDLHSLADVFTSIGL